MPASIAGVVLLGRDVLRLGVAEGPNLLALEALTGEITERLILILRARSAQACQRPESCRSIAAQP